MAGAQPDRQDFWETYRHPILTGLSSGLLIMLAVIVWIITLRRQVRLTTQSLQSSERRYRELIEASPDMTLLLGQDGGIRMANRIARETLDITPETEPGSFALWDALCDESQSCLQLRWRTPPPNTASGRKSSFTRIAPTGASWNLSPSPPQPGKKAIRSSAASAAT